MEALKAELAAKRKLKEQEFGGRKYVKRSEIEAMRTARLLEATRKENDSKGKRKEDSERTVVEDKKEADEVDTSANTQTSTSFAEKTKAAEAASEEDTAGLSNEEVIRRLRALGQPATLFGENPEDRASRLSYVSKNISVNDAAGGQQKNIFGLLIREMEAEAKRGVHAEQTKKEKKEKNEKEDKELEGLTEEEVETEIAFRRAAEDLAKKRAVEAMTIPQKIGHYFKTVLEAWEKDIETMPETFSRTKEGKLLKATFDTTKSFMQVLFKTLKRDALLDDLQRGLWLIVQAMQKRDYRDAMDVYMRCAIGNAPWPIGVTSVGIHDRSAREKIQAQSQAHIMHDE
ncbi:hypothetical protein CYMTET_6187, partial [Cymbomonas tetramitiformis]